MVSSSQTKKWKGWIVGLQLANNTHLQPITLFLLFWQKITENSNSSAASLCSPISASLPLVMERFFQQADKHYGTSGTLNHWWFTKHIEINMDQLLWPSDDLSLWSVSLLRPPLTALRLLLMHFTESQHWHIFLLSSAQKAQQSHRTEHTPKGSGGHSLTGTPGMGEYFKQAGWMFPVDWLFWLGFGFFSHPTPTFYHI